MPKERRDSSASLDRSKMSPYSHNSPRLKKSLPRNPLETEENEWEEAYCPVCMEHPHNAVLLICSSHDKGCRPFMCDTSYRHSNCLDQFRKSFKEASSTTINQDDAPLMISQSASSTVSAEPTITNWRAASHGEGSTSTQAGSCEDLSKLKLVCPLCRGHVSGWVVLESAREFMNAKSRSCACETCDYSGTYGDLRKHARQVHPLVRPTEADPERQRSWRRLERQRDLGDLLSTLQTSLIEESNEDGYPAYNDDSGWLTVLFLVRILRPTSGSRSRSWSGASRTRSAQVTIRRRPSRRLWGESYDWEADSRDVNSEASNGGSGS